jgi:hypothetical protein
MGGGLQGQGLVWCGGGDDHRRICRRGSGGGRCRWCAVAVVARQHLDGGHERGDGVLPVEGEHLAAHVFAQEFSLPLRQGPTLVVQPLVSGVTVMAPV